MSDPFYRSKDWHRLRQACLARDRMCTTPGCGARSVVADHIVQRARGGADSIANLRGLCTSCHNQRRQGGEPRAKGCDANGNPRDATHWWNSGNLSGLRGSDRMGGQRRVSSDLAKDPD